MLPGLFLHLQAPLEFCSLEICDDIHTEYQKEEGDFIENDSFYQLVRLVAFSEKNKTRKKKQIHK